MIKIRAPLAPACSQRAAMMFHGKRCVKADVRPRNKVITSHE